eukprot:1192880-Prorocentrum_minimum.AAC.2
MAGRKKGLREDAHCLFEHVHSSLCTRGPGVHLPSLSVGRGSALVATATLLWLARAAAALAPRLVFFPPPRRAGATSATHGVLRATLAPWLRSKGSRRDIRVSPARFLGWRDLRARQSNEQTYRIAKVS